MGILIQFKKTVKLPVRLPDDDEKVTYCAVGNSRRVAEAVASRPQLKGGSSATELQGDRMTLQMLPKRWYSPDLSVVVESRSRFNDFPLRNAS